MESVTKINKLIVRPLISEKSLKAIDLYNKYTFIVENASNKIELAKYIEKTFSVKVEGIQTIVNSGKIVRFGKKRTLGRRSDFKKAIVTLKKGDKINLFDIK